MARKATVHALDEATAPVEIEETLPPVTIVADEASEEPTLEKAPEAAEAAPAQPDFGPAYQHVFADAEIEPHLMADYAREIALMLQEIKDLEQEMKNQQQRYKSDIAMKEASLAKLLEKVREGKERREYYCRIEKDFDLKTKFFIDVATHKIVKSVELEARDYQLHIEDKRTAGPLFDEHVPDEPVSELLDHDTSETADASEDQTEEYPL